MIMDDLTSVTSAFIAHRQAANLSPDTIKAYQYQLRAFTEYSSAHRFRLQGLTAADIVGYFQARRTQGRPAPSLHQEFAAVHAMLTWALADRPEGDMVLRRVRWPKVPQPMIEPFSVPDVRHLLAAAGRSQMPQRDRAILMVMADTGVRAAEICGVKDTDVRDGRMRVFGKGGKYRWVPLGPQALEAIAEWRHVRPRTGGYLFVTRCRKPLSPRTLYDLFQRLGAKAGITDARCSPHTMRHTAATEWIKSGGDVRTLQKLLGHTAVGMTLRYVYASDDDVVKAHDKYGLALRLA